MYLLELELIETGTGYRLVGARIVEGWDKSEDFEILRALDRLGSLVVRLVRDNDPNERFFDIVSQVRSQIKTNSEQLDSLELWGQARVLQEAGYFDPSFLPELSHQVFLKPYLEPREIKTIEKYGRSLELYLKSCLEQTML